MGAVQVALPSNRGGITRSVSGSKQGPAFHLRLALLSLGLLLLLLRLRGKAGDTWKGPAGLFGWSSRDDGGSDRGSLGAAGSKQGTPRMPFRHLVVLCASPAPQRQRRQELRQRLHEDAAVAAQEMYSCTTHCLLVHTPVALCPLEVTRALVATCCRRAHFSLELRFVVGEQGLSDEQLRDVHEEDAVHADLLLLPHVRDTDTVLSYPEVFKVIVMR